MAIDRVGSFLREKTPRRFVALALFLGVLFAFRELFVLFVFFVAFERMLGAASRLLARRAGCSQKSALLFVIAAVLSVGIVGVVTGARRVSRAVKAARDHLPERLDELKANPLFSKVREHLPGVEKVTESAGHYASDVFHTVSAVGHVLIYVIIGFILAVVFLLEERELHAWRRNVDDRSLVGTLVQWFAYLADAISVTLQLQVIVAACNTALTLPVLFWLGIPHKIALMTLIFASGLVPVVGNIASGAVLSLLAYHAKGWLGVGIFVGLTFLLHKLEAYYLNPRLTARHVNLPGFILIVSLLAWEHVAGFAGLFLSFPFLFVAGKIRADFREEEARETPTPTTTTTTTDGEPAADDRSTT